MKRHKLIALGTFVALLAVIFMRPAARSVFMDGLVGIAEMTQRVCDDPCSLLPHRPYFLWNRFDPTCPQCL